MNDKPKSSKAKELLKKRRMAVKVKTAKKRSLSSTRWLERQLNDPYVAAAKEAGYRSRAAFKLMEIDDRFGFLKPGMKVVDLGAAPGGWSQVAAERIGKNGKIVGLDLQEIVPMEGAIFYQCDIFAEESLDLITEALGGKADIVLSDMAASSSGHAKTDHLRIVGLIEAAYDIAQHVLALEGTFIAKVLKGGTEGQLLQSLKKDFRKTQHIKPPASRKDSAEEFLIATGFRGAGE